MPLAPYTPIPPVLTSIIGRDRELKLVDSFLQSPAERLITLSGPGGVGKTRIAIEAARASTIDQAEGVSFVPLAPLTSTAQVVPAIAESLGIRRAGEVSQMSDLIDHLQSRQTLLVLDNFEHLLDASTEVLRLLIECPHLQCLVTSRTALRVPGEREVLVAPLTLPEVGSHHEFSTLANIPAVALFLERAQGVFPGFSLTPENACSVVEVCHRLDGLPLAIELAAPWVRVLSVRALRDHLLDRVQLLRVGQRDAPERHRTLWETLEWSYRLLSDRNKSVFRRCALFAASWSIPAAEAVSTRWDGDTSEEAATLQIMGALSDQSLIYPVEGASGEPRFAMLETVRAFARDCLDGANETDEVLTRLIAWGITYAGDARRASFGADQGQWFARLDDERVILRSAANSAIDRGDAVAALRLAGALTRFWWVRGHHPEDREWLERALSYDQAAPREAAAPPDVRALALLALGNFSFERGDLSEAAAAYENSIAIARAAKAHDDLGFGLLNLGMIAAQRGDLNRSWATFQEAIDVLEERGNHQRHAMVLTIFGGILALSGEPDRAATMLDQALGIHLSLNDTRMVIFTLNSLGDVARLRGHMSEAKRLYSQGHSLGKDLGERRGVATSLAGLGWLAIDMAAPADASTNMARSLALRVEIGDRLGQADCATGLAAAIVHTAPDQSARLLGAATTLRTAIGAIPLPVIGDAVNHITEAGRHLLGDEAFRQQVALGATHSAVDVLFDAYQTLSSSADSNTASLLTPASLPEPAVTAGNRRVAEPVGACGGETIASGSTAPRKTLPALSRREREVLALIVAGHQDREIAEALFLSPRTVSWHVTNIFNKLDVNSRVAAAVLAIRDGLVDNPRVTAQTHHSAPPNKVTWEWPSAS